MTTVRQKKRHRMLRFPLCDHSDSMQVAFANTDIRCQECASLLPYTMAGLLKGRGWLNLLVELVDFLSYKHTHHMKEPAEGA